MHKEIYKVNLIKFFNLCLTRKYKVTKPVAECHKNHYLLRQRQDKVLGNQQAVKNSYRDK